MSLGGQEVTGEGLRVHLLLFYNYIYLYKNITRLIGCINCKGASLKKMLESIESNFKTLHHLNL